VIYVPLKVVFILDYPKYQLANFPLEWTKTIQKKCFVIKH